MEGDMSEKISCAACGNTKDEIDALRKEVHMLCDEQDAFKDALRDVPDMIPVRGLWFLAETAMNIRDPDLKPIGKLEQRKRGLDVVPPKTELEVAAGLWVIIRDALRAAKERS